MGIPTIEQTVKERFQQLSQGQKKVAEYLLNNLEEFALSTASKIAREVEISETTVIRLSYALGFDSFSHMQKSIKQQFLTSMSGSSSYLDESDRSDCDEMNLIANIIEKDIAILKKMKKQMNISDLWKAVEWLMHADQVTVVGYRNSLPAAQWLFLKLSMLRDNVSLNPSNDSTFKELLTLNSNSVFFLLSFPSYVKDTLLLAEYCKHRGAKLITATDHIVSPVGRLSDIVFTTELNVSSNNLYSISSIISLLNIIVSAIELKYEAKTFTRVQQLQDVCSQLGIYIE